MNVHIVAFETSTNRCDVALLSCVQGKVRQISRSHDGAAEHAQHVLPMVDALLASAGVARNQLSAVAFGQGPGGFTGLRVACGLAQGMAFALGIPVIPVSSLLAIAAQDASDDRRQARLVLQDARMDELYGAAYHWDAQSGIWHTLEAPCLLGRGDAALWAQRVQSRRPDLAYRLLVDTELFPECRHMPGLHSAGQILAPQADTVALLALQAWQQGNTLDPALAAPLYVRDKVAYTTRERETGLGGNPEAPAMPETVQTSVTTSAPDLPSQDAVVIVPMRADHVAQVAAIERQVQDHPWTERNFQEALKAGYGAWVALRGDQVVGFSLLMVAPDVAHLLLIAVDRHSQRHGVGACLLAEAEAAALRQGVDSVILEVRQSNVQAQSFYRKHGYDRLSIRKGYYPALDGKREDALVLHKPLSKQSSGASASLEGRAS